MIGLWALCALTLFPFIDKPFHMDDPLFLWTARQIHRQPLNFYGFNVNWQTFASPMSDEMKNPPLAAYYIALVTGVFGESEVALHLAFLLISMATAAGLFFLARRFTSRPFLAASVAILSPAFLVTATGVMSDLPALCFWIWAMVAWIEGVDRDRPWLIPVGGLLIAAGALTKYPVMNLIPLLGAYAIMHRRRLVVQMISLAIPIVVLVAYQIWTKHLYGHGLLTGAAGFAAGYAASSLTIKVTIARTLICLASVGGCTLTAALLLPLAGSLRTVIGALLFGIAVAVLAIFVIAPSRIYDDDHQLRIAYLVQLGLMACGGAGLMVLTLHQLNRLRDRDTLFLALWIGGTYCFTQFVNWGINARTILPMVPALAIVVCRAIERREPRPREALRVAVPVVIGGAITFAVAIADYCQALAGKTAAAHIAEIVPAPADGHRLLFTGHWGFQWYMEKIGGTCFDDHTARADVGDWVVMALNNYGLVRFSTHKLNVAGNFGVPITWFISTHSLETGSGFYFAGNTQLPFIVSPVPQEMFILCRVMEPFDQSSNDPVTGTAAEPVRQH